jgi:hypothetical protein
MGGMGRNSTILIAAAAIFSAVLGFVYGATFSNGCSQASDAHLGCIEFIFFRYQTFIGILGALAAAYIAARPIWQQVQDNQAERHARRIALSLLLFGDMLAFSGDLQRFIKKYSILAPLPQLPPQLLSVVDELHLLGETGGRLLQMIGLMSGVQRQTAALLFHDPGAVTAEAGMVSGNNVRLLTLALYDCEEAAAQLGQMAQPTS